MEDISFEETSIDNEIIMNPTGSIPQGDLIHDHEIELKLRRIEELKEKLSLANCFNPSKADKIKIRLYKKRIAKEEKELKDLRGKQILPDLIW